MSSNSRFVVLTGWHNIVHIALPLLPLPYFASLLLMGLLSTWPTSPFCAPFRLPFFLLSFGVDVTELAKDRELDGLEKVRESVLNAEAVEEAAAALSAAAAAAAMLLNDAAELLCI